MRLRVKTKGFDSLQIQLSRREKRGKGGTVAVGYTAKYAMIVHENVGAQFKTPGTQAKFLEEPFRVNRDRYMEIILKTVKSGGNFFSGVMLAALTLQRDSQRICPIDTGHLRASAYTKKVK